MTVKYGIIGLGNIAHRFAGVLNKAEGVELVAVASREQKRSDEFAVKYGAKSAYDSYEALIADKEVDIIYIALTHNFHYDIIKKCILNRKAVLCEKPMVITADHAAELIELAEERNVLLMEAMWTRCLPAFQKARRWVADGLIGKVSLVDASFSFNMPFIPTNRLFDPNLAGGSLYDAGVYPIEFATGILDEAPNVIKGVAHLCETGVDDFFSMSLGFNSGALASLTCGLRSNTSRDALVYGTEGKIIVYNFLGTNKCELYNKKDELVETFEDTFEDGFIYEIQHAAQLYRNGQIDSPLIPLRDTYACAVIFDKLIEGITH